MCVGILDNVSRAEIGNDTKMVGAMCFSEVSTQ